MSLDNGSTGDKSPMSGASIAKGSDRNADWDGKPHEMSDLDDYLLAYYEARARDGYDRSQSPRSRSNVAPEGTAGTGGDMSQTGAQTEADIQYELNSPYPGNGQTSLEWNSAVPSHSQASVAPASTQR
jgi:hypothetical protein